MVSPVLENSNGPLEGSTPQIERDLVVTLTNDSVVKIKLDLNSSTTLERNTLKKAGITLEEVKNVFIPKGVTCIEEACFWGCVSLKEVTLPSTVESIQHKAFTRCSNLEIVDFQNGISSFKNLQFFSEFKGLDLRVAGKSVKKLDFSKSSDNEVVDSGSEEVNKPSTSSDKESLPSSSTEINSEASVDLSNGNLPKIEHDLVVTLTNGNVVKIKLDLNSSTTLERDTFGKAGIDLKEVKEVVIPEGVKSIGVCCFWECGSLENVTIPSSVETIGDVAFSGCKNLKAIELPEGLKRIGKSCFYGCDSLVNITIPSSVETIGDRAFSYCKNLKTVELLKSAIFTWRVCLESYVKMIGKQAFLACDNLKTVVMPKGTKVGADAFPSYTVINRI